MICATPMLATASPARSAECRPVKSACTDSATAPRSGAVPMVSRLVSDAVKWLEDVDTDRQRKRFKP